MSLYDYLESQKIAAKDYPFYALLMAAMWKADSENTHLLRRTWPDVWHELDSRYRSPGGVLPEDEMGQQLIVETDADQRSDSDRRKVNTIYDGSEGDQRIRDRRKE